MHATMLCLLYVVALSGCAMAPQCSVGVALLGPVPVPTFSCDLIGTPEEDDEDE